MIISTRALIIATVIGTVLQLAMVIVGHTNPSVAKLFAMGGSAISLVAGVIYAMQTRGATVVASVTGGLIAGALCAFIGIAVSWQLHDVPASILGVGTLGSAVTGAIGGWLGRLLA